MTFQTPRKFHRNPAVDKRRQQKASPSALHAAIAQHLADSDQRNPLHQQGEDSSFFVADLGTIERLYDLWQQQFDHVRPFYAVKCNPDPVLLYQLAQLGAGFDCASISEIKAVLALGNDPTDIIFANPCKTPAAMTFASNVGVRMMTFDNIGELDAIKQYAPSARLLLRIFACDENAVLPLHDKFGAAISSCLGLLRRAQKLDLDVIGISFHVGSGASDAAAYATAIHQASDLLSVGREMGLSMHTLDLGGGFVDCPFRFQKMASLIREALATAKMPPDVNVVAEPGRFFARTPYTLVCRIHSIRQSWEQAVKSSHGMLYQNDGVYKHFMNRLVENEDYKPMLLPAKSDKELERGSGPHTYSVWGPTCDSTDCISKESVLDGQAHVGDWLLYQNMGAYTTACATSFNGFASSSDVVYIRT